MSLDVPVAAPVPREPQLLYLTRSPAPPPYLGEFTAPDVDRAVVAEAEEVLGEFQVPSRGAFPPGCRCKSDKSADREGLTGGRSTLARRPPSPQELGGSTAVSVNRRTQSAVFPRCVSTGDRQPRFSNTSNVSPGFNETTRCPAVWANCFTCSSGASSSMYTTVSPKTP